MKISCDELLLPSSQDEQLVDNLLCSEEPEDLPGGAGFSLTQALLPLVEASFPPPAAPWVCSTRYKTELCTSYAATGACKYADRCQFAHGLNELHVPFRHPKYKTELCRNYHTTGYCYYGARCLFAHSPTELRQALQQRRNVPCRRFLAHGVCPFGKRCNFLHVEEVEADGGSPAAPSPPPQRKEWGPQGPLCNTFSSFGFCLYGTSCRFQHRLPSKARSPDLLSPRPPSTAGLPPASSNGSSPPSSSSTSPSPEAAVHNAFTFSSQHLSDLLLPLALHLQQLEASKGQEVWDNMGL
ncbi:PREDICTED: zinc finger protein 36, C3H1 type-like 2-B [Cyprinodon variegatus]|uniref:zinc finger protein 36, C3H1 type-like 2-B n=1 Tax=Cyprinodon variegatus TaxID=28743 RepID=UPI000742A8EA|nr:PREDICTED: zinc finger protein 36, C3H1 type-like 2-B [Cyprinodon variegatus]